MVDVIAVVAAVVVTVVLADESRRSPFARAWVMRG